MQNTNDDLGIVRFWSVFRDPRLEGAFADFRRIDEVRSAALALLAGGLAYAGGGISDSAVFAAFPAELAQVRLLRALGVALCLGGAAWIWKAGSLRVVQVVCPAAMLGTLVTYSAIAAREENLMGGSDYRMVFSVFSLLLEQKSHSLLSNHSW